jgi:hypothetical protein
LTFFIFWGNRVNVTSQGVNTLLGALSPIAESYIQSLEPIPIPSEADSFLDELTLNLTGLQLYNIHTTPLIIEVLENEGIELTL